MPQVNCKLCRKEFYAKPSWIKEGNGKYCSRDCGYKSHVTGAYFNCEICKKKVWRIPSKIRHSKSGTVFCNKSCQTLWRNKFYSGPLHPKWNGGTDIYRKILIKTGRPIVCEACGYDNEKVILAHHIDKNRKNNVVENLKWLCRNCHYLVHKYNKLF